MKPGFISAAGMAGKAALAALAVRHNANAKNKLKIFFVGKRTTPLGFLSAHKPDLLIYFILEYG
jgi:hypothetical protein